MNYKLPDLPFKKDALEPHISEETIEYHYGKHHQKYVDKLNDLTKGSDFEGADLEDIIKNADGAIFNNGAQVWNHTFYFEGFSKDGRREPEGELAEAIKSSFGSFDKFRDQFATEAAGLFGSGWVWLVKDDKGSLSIVQKPNAENPLRDGHTPLLTCDVWEHAYYIDYRNKRPDYVKSFWEIVDWDIIASRF